MNILDWYFKTPRLVFLQFYRFGCLQQCSLLELVLLGLPYWPLVSMGFSGLMSISVGNVDSVCIWRLLTNGYSCVFDLLASLLGESMGFSH